MNEPRDTNQKKLNHVVRHALVEDCTTGVWSQGRAEPMLLAPRREKVWRLHHLEGGWS